MIYVTTTYRNLPQNDTIISECQVHIQPQTSPNLLILSSPWDIFWVLGELDLSLTTFLILSPQKMCSSPHLFNKHVPSSHLVPGTVLEAGASKTRLFHVQPCREGRQTNQRLGCREMCANELGRAVLGAQRKATEPRQVSEKTSWRTGKSWPGCLGKGAPTGWVKANKTMAQWFPP